LSVETTATSPCPSPKPQISELDAPIPVAPIAVDAISNLTSAASPDAFPSTIQHKTRLTSKPLSIFTLFHTQSAHLSAVSDRITSQLYLDATDNDSSSTLDTPVTPTYDTLFHNNIQLGSTDDLRAALQSITLSGNYSLHDTNLGTALTDDCAGRRLIERVLELIMVERVEYESVLDAIALSADKNIELVNYGPGTGLARVTMRSLKERVPDVTCTFRDVSSPALPSLRRPVKPSDEPIAIVGMAVNLPGAKSTDELWRVLEQGINTVEEVSCTFGYFLISSHYFVDSKYSFRGWSLC
jgi:hypothetical protein